MTDKRKTAHVRITYTVDSCSGNIGEIVEFIFCFKTVVDVINIWLLMPYYLFIKNREIEKNQSRLSIFRSKCKNNVEYS